jgi:hypothetical protein
MTMPGFSAGAALSEPAEFHPSIRCDDPRQVEDRRQRVVLAIPKDGGNPRVDCIMDCMDPCMDSGNTATMCQSRCSRLCSGGSTGAGPSPAPNPVNHALCVGGCWAWWAACTADMSVLTAGLGQPFCDYTRDQCLQPCP